MRSAGEGVFTGYSSAGICKADGGAPCQSIIDANPATPIRQQSTTVSGGMRRVMTVSSPLWRQMTTVLIGGGVAGSVGIRQPRKV